MFCACILPENFHYATLVSNVTTSNWYKATIETWSISFIRIEHRFLASPISFIA